MKKTAYVSVTYLFTFEPADVGLSDDCTKKEFYEAVDALMERKTDLVGMQADIFPNDIEIDLCGNYKE